MDLKQIQYFIALFEDGSVTRAAKRLNIVQPALSMQVAKLEEELHQQLFERGSHGMTPTAAGRLMYRLFLPIMRDLAHARQQLIQRDEIVTGRVSIGLIASISESVLADSLSRYHEKYPHVEVTVSDGYSATFIDWVAGGQLDAALINKPRGKLSLDAHAILDEEMVLATSAAHGPDLPHAIELAKLPELELVLPTKRHGLRGVLDTAAQHEDVLLTPRFEIDVLSSIVQLVGKTRFATILPRIVVERAVRAGTLRAYPILAPRIVRHIVCITHPRRPLSAAAEALISIIADELRQVLNAAPPDATKDTPAPTKKTSSN
ncbi:LysR family transcriptional regulator [Paraburkholderia fungorum]|uniref:LysR family transcriptional regulator n=1 Tax=Paraburkholderia fungorum TaxID=134537 RepID=UPI0004AAC576|nr:LysR family transcriptional regulator [Paraburkholderia fungorum]KFX61331.1 LysR family transcriptional regulator [Burkholderia sp. K24]MDE1004447.1 LysR family transcriptional regulator [Paraburkholderia fungorum]USX07112.1 LysR family transcriptional regulator [Paraburkholderia fungorum]